MSNMQIRNTLNAGSPFVRKPVAAMALAGLLILGLAQPAFADSRSETRATGDFSKISSSGGFELEITAGQPSASVVVNADSDVLPEVKTEVRGDVLRITMENDHFFSSGRALVKITVPKLSSVSASGSTTITASNLTGASFEMKGSGSTKAVLRGSVGELAIKVSGSGRVDAGALTSKTADIHTSGSGEIEVNASDKLDVHISGAGKVTYSGHPVISEKVSGSGTITAKN